VLTKYCEEKEKEKKVNIIITNSLQNDFLEEDFQDFTKEYPPLNYDICQELWMDCCDETPKDISFFENLIEKAKKCAEKYALEGHDLEKSKEAYLKYIVELKHRVHIDPGQSKRIWQDGGLEHFIKDLLERSYKINKTEQANEVYYLVHLRDWHDPTEAIQKAELRQFGEHCIKGTHGAKFIKPLDNYLQDKKYDFFNTIINSNSLSSFTETNLDIVLEQIMATEESSKKEVEIGIFGVVTDIKILLLTFELTVVYKYENVYVCEDLCAGFNQKKHFDGINYIKNVLGVKVYNLDMFREKFHIPKLNY